MPAWASPRSGTRPKRDLAPSPLPFLGIVAVPSTTPHSLNGRATDTETAEDADRSEVWGQEGSHHRKGGQEDDDEGENPSSPPMVAGQSPHEVDPPIRTRALLGIGGLCRRLRR